MQGQTPNISTDYLWEFQQKSDHESMHEKHEKRIVTHRKALIGQSSSSPIEALIGQSSSSPNRSSIISSDAMSGLSNLCPSSPCKLHPYISPCIQLSNFRAATKCDEVSWLEAQWALRCALRALQNLQNLHGLRERPPSATCLPLPASSEPMC